MKNWHKWTPEEDKVLVQAVKANPHNKRKAFRNASLKLDRTVESCSSRWYNALSDPENKNYVGCIFTMVSRNTSLTNRVFENTHVKQRPVKAGIWNKIKKLLGL